MKKAWKVVAIIVAAAIVIGLLLVGIGLLTGSDLTRVWAVMDEKYHVEMYMDYAGEVVRAIIKPFVS